MKRTLKKELKVLETHLMEAFGISVLLAGQSALRVPLLGTAACTCLVWLVRAVVDGRKSAVRAIRRDVKLSLCVVRSGLRPVCSRLCDLWIVARFGF